MDLVWRIVWEANLYAWEEKFGQYEARSEIILALVQGLENEEKSGCAILGIGVMEAPLFRAVVLESSGDQNHSSFMEK